MCCVVLDYDGYVKEKPTCLSVLGDEAVTATVISYVGGASRPIYYMPDTIFMVKHEDETMDQLLYKARKVAPLARRVVVFGKGVSRYGAREDSCAVCVDRGVWQRQVYVC